LTTQASHPLLTKLHTSCCLSADYTLLFTASGKQQSPNLLSKFRGCFRKTYLTLSVTSELSIPEEQLKVKIAKRRRYWCDKQILAGPRAGTLLFGID